MVQTFNVADFRYRWPDLRPPLPPFIYMYVVVIQTFNVDNFCYR